MGFCERSVALVPDLHDADGDPATPVVLFDRAFGYRDSPRERGGYPVVQVLVSATGGGWAQSIAAEVTPVSGAFHRGLVDRAALEWKAAGMPDAMTIDGAFVIGRG